ncbi:MAG: deoxyribodipyrimidine photo-lyase [Pseudorhodoplanes sp.]|uniref:cryptochrome/photolyase family protein n=1 Tax=Pseudorhodoplanes sp. TaxID=1934341 RepID=UPI003D0C3986
MPDDRRSSAPFSAIVWFRDDLRLGDHPALTAAARAGTLTCLYLLDQDSAGLRAHGGASRWWLAQSLRALDANLRKLGQRLVLRRGKAADVIPSLAHECGATHVYWNRRYDRAGIAADEAVIAALKARGVTGGTFPGSLLVEPGKLLNKDGGPLRVFTPFWKRVLSLGDPRRPLPAPKRLPPPLDIASSHLEDWHLEPTMPDWAGGLRATWTPGEAAARQRLADFLDTIRGYADERDRPDRPSTSRLSPHLRFGEVSAGEVFHAARFAAEKGDAPSRDIEKYLSELGWREFSYHLLHHFPDLATKNLQPRFDAFPWRSDDAALKAWQRGQTGYPIVDAGMRELWHTGWMHNRVRMVVASFLIKHLLIDWRLGEQWFWDTLVDADPANNTASWQWVAGSGADAAPYFRIFNPILQGERFDPNGDYVRQWVPEIAALPDRFIHKPWMATPLELAEAKVTLGKTYPAPMVDHDLARKRALAAFDRIKG